MQDEPRVVAALEALRAQGVCASRSTTSAPATRRSRYLRRLPVDTLKIDRSFVRDIAEQRRRRRAHRRRSSSMARALRLRVVAEGVETEAQRELLRGFGCDEMQGYLVCARAAPAEIEACDCVARGERRDPSAIAESSRDARSPRATTTSMRLGVGQLLVPGAEPMAAGRNVARARSDRLRAATANQRRRRHEDRPVHRLVDRAVELAPRPGARKATLARLAGRVEAEVEVVGLRVREDVVEDLVVVRHRDALPGGDRQEARREARVLLVEREARRRGRRRRSAGLASR